MNLRSERVHPAGAPDRIGSGRAAINAVMRVRSIRVRAPRSAICVAVLQVRGAGEPFRPSLMSLLAGNSQVPERLVTEMYARRRDATGELLIP